MEDNIKSLPNNYVGIICSLNDNKNNTYVIVPEEISLGKINQDGLFQSENGEYELHSVEDFETYPEDEIFYCYLTTIDNLRAMYPEITETTMLMVKYYQEIASQIYLLLCDKGEVEIYRAPYSSISKNIGGTLSKRFEENQEAEKQNAPSIYLPDNTVKTLDSIDALDLENYLKERIFENDDILEDIATTIAMNYRARRKEDVESMLSIGPTGSGKTETYRLIAEYLNVPLTIYDCNLLTAGGYVGKDLDDVFREVVINAGKDLKKAEKSILVFDEIDKIATRGMDVKDLAVQYLLLKAMDGSSYTFALEKNGRPVTLDTSFMTIAGLGAFSDLYKQKEKKKSKLGFATGEDTEEERVTLTPEDLIDYGMLAELMGRFYLTHEYKKLGPSDLRRILIDSKGSPLLRKQQRYLEEFGYELTWDDDSYTFDFTCHDMRDLLAFVLPGMYVESGTSLKAEVSKEGQLTAHLNSGRIAFKRHYMKGLSAEFDNLQNSFNADINCEEIMASSIRLYDNDLQIHADDNRIGIGFKYDNHSELENKGELYLNSTLTREDGRLEAEIDIRPSSLYMNSKEWEIMPSTITLKGKEMKIESFGLISGEEYIGLYGGTSENGHDNLNFELQRFDISLLNSILGDKFGISGFMTGHARLTSPLTDKGLFIDMVCDSTYIAEIPLGVVSIGSGLNEEKNGLDIALINEIEGRSSIALSGNLSLKQRKVEAKASLDRLSIGYAKPFLSTVFSEMDGYISGNVDIYGPFDSLAVSSENTRLDSAELKIAYTNVPYIADGAFHLDSKGVYFDDITIKDRFNGTGTVGGSINWNNFRNFNFDTHIRVNEIEGVNLTEDMNETFYGSIFGSGNVSITGPTSSLLLNVDAVTAKEGQLHIPMNAAGAGGKGTNLLKFTKVEKEIFIDPYEEMISNIQQKEAEESNLTVKVRVNANPDVEAFVEIDKASGNVLSGRGNGVIDLEIGNDMFEINGDYTLTGGNYKFVAIGLVSRDFEIQDGSSVRFNGDILESTLDIDALYKTKASLSTLIADTTSVANRRTVECGINITEKISNPRLSFSIEIPDLDPMVKSRVESALSTEDKVQKQFLSLLLSNSFLPDEQSGIVNNTTLLYSNVSEAMANQLNNIFQKLDIPLDLGLNYQPNEKGNDIFDVAVSTQLFNNRVVVNGSVGNKQYNSGGTQDVVGDIDIEIKLDRSGSFRLNLFSHSADSYTNYLDNSQRSGVGLTYQTEFNSLGQFFRNMFMSKAKRQAARQAEEQAMIDGGKVELKIEAPEKKNKDERRKR